MEKMVKVLIGIGVAVVLLIILLCASITSVPVGSTGVVIRFGSTTGQTMTDGWHFKVPFIESVVDISNKVMKTDVAADSISRDLQAITSNISINYHLAAENSADIYRRVGLTYEDTLLQPAIQEAVKAVMAKYSAEELITNRSVVSSEISEEIRTKIGVYGIIIDEFNLTNFSFSDEFDAAIEAKQIAEQDKIKAATEKEKKTIEAEAAAAEKTIAAEAEAEAIKTKAEAEAEAIKTKADAQADANKKIRDSLSEEVLENKKLETWDGVLPKVSTGSGASIIVDAID